MKSVRVFLIAAMAATVWAQTPAPAGTSAPAQAAAQPSAAAKDPKPAVAAPPAPVLPKLKMKGDVQDALDRISVLSMKAHVQFLSADALAGRATPSPGLDAAAEYIASQFVRMGLEPVGADGYFQYAEMIGREFDPAAHKFTVKAGDREFDLSSKGVQYLGYSSVAATGAAIFKITTDNVKQVKPEDLTGKVVVIDVPQNNMMAINGLVSKGKPVLLLSADPALRRMVAMAGGMGRIAFAEDGPQRSPFGAPFAMVSDKVAAEALKLLPAGASDWTVTATEKPVETKVRPRNVAGIVRGSDPVLKDQFIVVSAHYDHVGMRPEMEGDNIWNGANDDASGTASMMELASTFAKMKVKPKRSMLFLAFFGEEAGLLGSRYYGKHPLVPLAQTIANVNLEHMGRTDSSEGPKVNYGSFTGSDFSNMPSFFMAAGKLTGVEVVKDEKRSDPFFARSDNMAMARVGIPSHTICVAFEFPDYHQPGDSWEKLDYDNMVRVNRMLALGLMMMGNSPQAPVWNEANPKVKQYAEAAKKLKALAEAGSTK